MYGNAEVILWDYKLGQRLKTLRPHIPVEVSVRRDLMEKMHILKLYLTLLNLFLAEPEQKFTDQRRARHFAAFRWLRHHRRL